MHHTHSRTLTIESAAGHKLETKIFRVFLGAFILLLAGYIFLIGHMTFSIIAKKGFESETHVLKSKLGELELSYLDARNKVTLDLAKSMGYIETTQFHFALDDHTREALSLR